mmetsp:Transcript_50814/g.142830  ORF Transcript_50814/g.142830 Transcript_50814/m.142830 type:complete len:158 (+) Transcript_50814:1-474(+)
MWPYVPVALTASAVKAAIVAGSPAPIFEGKPGLPHISSRATSWVRALLERDPIKRPSAQAALEHPDFLAAWEASPACLKAAIVAARRCGTFDVVQGDVRPTELDDRLAELGSTQRPATDCGDVALGFGRRCGRRPTLECSTVSTDMGSETAVSTPSR